MGLLMKTFRVILESTTGETSGYQFFYLCSAQNKEEAERQALADYPNDLIVRVESNEGSILETLQDLLIGLVKVTGEQKTVDLESFRITKFVSDRTDKEYVTINILSKQGSPFLGLNGSDGLLTKVEVNPIILDSISSFLVEFYLELIYYKLK